MRPKALQGNHGDIGTRLKALYAAAEQEPLPERLLALLEQLDQAEEADGRGAGKPQEPS